MQKKTDGVNRNANQLHFGLQFQTAAAASLLIDYLRQFKSIKNEGDEDIVIKLDDDTIVYAQAKSSFDENSRKATSDFKAGLKTLAENAENTPQYQLIYITNIRKLLGAKTETSDFYNGVSRSYYELDENNKKLIEDYAPISLQLDRFAIQYLKFTGSDDNKLTSVLNKLSEEFESYDALKKLSAKQVLNTWIMYLNNTASNKDTNTCCDRKQIVWGMILHKIDHIFNEYSDESDSNYDRILYQYDVLIENITSRFDIISRISGDYYLSKDSSEKDSSESFKNYAQSNWKCYLDIIDELNIPESDQSTILIILIRTLLEKMNVIRDVKKEMNI